MKPTISLCVITGNESVHVSRFLESFAPLFDELCLVRAVGNQSPDDTVDRARAYCQRNGKAFKIREYRNAEKADWPHVDNFGAARQSAFDLATADWCMWADLDDVVEADSITAILSAVEEGNHDAYFCAYVLPGQHESCLRERVTRRGCGKWVGAIHENYALKVGTKYRIIHGAEILHAPTVNKAKDTGRNMRILRAQVNGTESAWYHLARESVIAYYRENNRQGEKSKKHAAEAHRLFAIAESFGTLTPEEQQVGELYRACLYRDAGEHDNALAMGWRALGTLPDRRAPYGAIAEAYLALDKPRKALGIARAMSAIPMPPPSGLPIDAKMHGWHGIELLQRCNRAAGDEATARRSERELFAKAGRKISVLHATRGRPQKAIQARADWLASASQASSVEWIFAVDEDDAESIHALRHYRKIIVPTPSSCVKAWNAAYEASEGHVVIQMSDDWWPCMDWDMHVWNHLSLAAQEKGGTIETTPLALHVNDGGRDDHLMCIAICNRARVTQQEGGHLFWPEYDGMYSDNEYSLRAYRDGVVVDARKYITMEHRHPAFGKAEMDATYQKQNDQRHYEAGKAIFERRNAQ